MGRSWATHFHTGWPVLLASFASEAEARRWLDGELALIRTGRWTPPVERLPALDDQLGRIA